MMSIGYADMFARRNAVAKFSCNPGDLTDHPSLPARSKFAPHHPPSEVPAPVLPVLAAIIDKLRASVKTLSIPRRCVDVILVRMLVRPPLPRVASRWARGAPATLG